MNPQQVGMILITMFYFLLWVAFAVGVILAYKRMFWPDKKESAERARRMADRRGL